MDWTQYFKHNSPEQVGLYPFNPRLDPSSNVLLLH